MSSRSYVECELIFTFVTPGMTANGPVCRESLPYPGAVRTGLAARVLAGGVEVISPEVLLASDKAGLLCGRTHHPRRSTWAVAAWRRRRGAAVLVLEGGSVTKQHRNRASVQVVVVWTHARRPVVVVIPASYSFLRKGADAQSASE